MPGSSGAGSPASIFPVDDPRGLACDDIGNVYVTSRTAVRQLLAADPTGQSSGVVDGTGAVRTIYENSNHTCLTAIATDGFGKLFTTDSCTGAGIELELGEL